MDPKATKGWRAREKIWRRVKDFKNLKHSPVGASSSSRWLACPGSVGLSMGIPSTQSAAAAEGTKAHLLAELMLRPALAQRDLHGRQKYLESDLSDALDFSTLCDYPRAMRENVFGYVRYCWDEILEYQPKRVFLESRVVYDEELGMFGRLDLGFGYSRDKRNHGRILDYKNGRKVAEVSQIPYYGDGMLSLFPKGTKPFSSIRGTIYQPNSEACDKGAPAEKTVVLTRAELDEWRERLTNGARRALAMVRGELEPEYVVGDHCGFCPARVKCEAFLGAKHSKAGLAFSDPEVMLPVALNPTSPEVIARNASQAAALFGALGDIRSFLDAFESYCHAAVDSAEDHPLKGHLKFVQSTAQGRRSFVEASVVAPALQELGVEPFQPPEPKLRGVGEIEKELKKMGVKLPENLVRRAKVGRKLVLINDPRKAIGAADAFSEPIDDAEFEEL